MSISDTLRRAGPYATNGAQTAFPFSFKVFEENHVVVTKVTNGVSEELIFGSGFTVSLNADQDTTPGGVVTISPALAAGSTITLLSDAPYEQPVEFSNQGGFYPAVLNDALDRATIQIQQIVEQLSRTLTIPSGTSAAALNGLFLTMAAGGVTELTPQAAAALVNPYIGGIKGDPGGNAMAVGLGTEITGLNIPVGTDMIQTNGYAARGDYGAARYIAIDTPHADWTWPQARDRWMMQSANGRWFMLDPSQSITPEMFGAVGDAEYYPGDLTTSPYYSEDLTRWQTDAYTGPGGVGLPTDDWEAMRALTDYATFMGGGLWFENRPGAIYAFAEPRKAVNGSNTKYQVRRRDLRLVERIEEYDDGVATDKAKWNPTLDGVDGLTWNFNGSKWVQLPYHIPEGGHVAGDPRWHARGLKAYKCQNVRITGYQIDMNWRKHTSWSGRGFQRNDWGMKLEACRNWLIDGGWIHDSPHDGFYLNHRWESLIGGMAARLDADLTNQPTSDPAWTSATPNDLYWPHGENENIVIRNFDVSNCARQAMSIIGGRRIFILGGRWSGTQQYLGTAPLNRVGAANHGLDNWRLPGLSPGCWIDAEPNREHPKGVEFVTVIGARVYDNFSMWGATGQGEFTRVENSFLPAAVDTAANTITIDGTRLPTALIGQKVRLYNEGGALPGGISRYVDYWINRPYASDTFTLHRAQADAVAGVNPVDITDQGTGTHYIAVFHAKSQVHNVRLIDCDLDHPAWGGDAFPGETTRLYIHGGSLFNRSRSRPAIQDKGAYQSEFDMEGMEIRVYEGLVNSDDTGVVEVVTIDAAADTVNGTDLRLDPYGFDRVRFYSTGDLPAPLVSNRDYFATHVTDDQCKLSVSPEAARAGTYIDLTSTGSGTISMHKPTSHVNVRNSRVLWTVPDGFEFDCTAGAVDTATDTITFPDAHDFSNRGEDSITIRPYAGASLPAPLVAGTTYYPIVVDQTRIKLAASSADAVAGTAIDLTAVGTGWARVGYTIRGQVINQRGTWDNVEFFFDRRTYPPGLSSVDALFFTRSGELRNLHFRSDLPEGGGIYYVVLNDCPHAMVDSFTFMANGTTQLSTHSAKRIGFDRPRQDRVTWWETDANQTFAPRTGGKAALLNVQITANRTFTLSTTGAYEGQVVEVRRTANATGAFTFTGHGATLSNAGESATFIFRNGAWLWIGE